MRSTILLFHRVNPQRDRLWDPMPPELFEKVIRYVASNYEVLPLEKVCLQNESGSKSSMAITFDDGYKDYIDYALPILESYHLPSSMFVVPQCVISGMPTWTYIMDYLFFNTTKLELPFFDYGRECEDFAIYEWRNSEERIQYAAKFKQYLKRVPNRKRVEIIEHFSCGFNDVALPENLMMTWDDLRRLKGKGIEIGSHSLSHPPLATIEDEDELHKEIKLSGEIIEEELGFFPTTISYPVGSYNEKVKSISHQSGYKIGLAVDQKIYDPGKQDIFQVPRIELYNESFLRTKLKISGIEGTLRSIFKL
ncbi:MAG: polysaccharide deacetylase family protein [Flavobacterium sp.]|nr:MAG: polysaccharide deacetylase family protein [Flavobacterium sp.]